MDQDKQETQKQPSQPQQGEKPSDHVGFDPEQIQKEFQEMVQKKFGGRVQVLSMEDPLGLSSEESEAEQLDPADFEEVLQSFDYKPRDVKNHLDRFVIGQDEAKVALSIAICDHYNHLKQEQSNSDRSHYQKQNLLIMGPTGVGKTYLVRLIADFIGVPFIKADATRFSEVGYMGANVDDIIRDLVQVAKGDVKAAENGIVYVDEVDKLASRRDQSGRDVSGRGVQFGFLRLLENSDVDLNASHDMASQFKTFMNFQKKGKAEKEIVNTRNILFIFSGAFHGLEENINKRLGHQSIGLHTAKDKNQSKGALKFAEAQDLVQFGFEHEFIGRLPIRVACDPLSEADLVKILKDSEHSIVKQYCRSFELYGIKLSFTDEALQQLAELAHQQGTGARGLTAAFETVLRPFKFSLPSTEIKSLEVNAELVSNPQGYLHHLLSH